jgi:hypothetical protein
VGSPSIQATEMLDGVYKEVIEMHHHREIWRFFNNELPKHGADSTVHEALARWYVDAQAAAVRRITGARSQDKRSMAKLLEGIQTNLAQFQDNGNGIDEDGVKLDLASLKTETANITRWADETVAHMGRTQSVNPTFGELDKAIDLLGTILKKYYQLITGGYLSSVEPVIQSDWRGPFRTAWL